MIGSVLDHPALPIDARRNLTIDFIRGVLALNVCLFHLAYGTISLTDNNVLSQISILNPFRYHLFFLLSGFTIPYALNRHGYQISHFGNFMARRWIRLAPPAYIAMIGMIIVQIGSILIKGSPISGVAFPGFQWNDILGNLLFHTRLFDTSLYYSILQALQIELQFYIIIGLGFGFLNQSKKSSIVFILLLIAASCVFEVLPWGDFPVFPMLPFFTLGILVYLVSIQRFSLGEIMPFVCISLLCCFFIQGASKTLSAIVVFFLLMNVPSLNIKVFNFLGKISYSIFLIHIIVALAIDGIYKLFLYTPLSVEEKTLFLLIVMSVVILAASWFYRFIEKPFLLYSRKVKY